MPATRVLLLMYCLCSSHISLGSSSGTQDQRPVQVVVERSLSIRQGAVYTRRVSFQTSRVALAIDFSPVNLDLPTVTVYRKSFETGESSVDLGSPDLYFGSGDLVPFAMVWFGDSTMELEGYLNSQTASIKISCSHIAGLRRLLLSPRASATCSLRTADKVASHLEAWETLQNNATDARGRREAPGDGTLHATLHAHNATERPERKKSEVPRNASAGRPPRSCKLHLIADHLFHKQYGKGDLRQTVGAMVAAVAIADTLFRGTDFDGDGYGDNVGFEIQNISVVEESFPGYFFDESINQIGEYLNRLTLLHFEDYCQGVAFTFRPFLSGVLGLAWIANSDTVFGGGGICKSRSFIHHLQRHGSLNTLVVTAWNRKGGASPFALGRTLTHELGHAFGSVHDDPNDPRCSTALGSGVFIMDTHCADGSLPNHFQFSPCSLEQMNPVLVKKGHCLVAMRKQSCGNFRVEPGEDCDCGNELTCAHLDPCCVPTGQPGECRLSAGSLCSPAQSPCCTLACRPTLAVLRKECSPPTECASASYCDGRSPSCPAPCPRPSGTPCDSGRKLCLDGQCIQSICEALGLQPCLCTKAPRDMCKLCCTRSNSSDCRPAWNFGILGPDGEVLYLSRGSYCGAGVGYCSGRVCISEGAIADRIAHVLHPDALLHVEGWFRRHWLYLLGTAGAISVAAIAFIALCSRHKDRHMEALRVGKLVAIREQALRLKAEMDLSMLEVEWTVDSLIEQFTNSEDSESQDTDDAVGRLLALFPKVSYEEVTRILTLCSTEDTAVRLMLSMGYMMHGNLIHGLQEM